MDIKDVTEWLKDNSYNYEISSIGFQRFEIFKHYDPGNIFPWCHFSAKKQEALADLHRKRGYV